VTRIQAVVSILIAAVAVQAQAKITIVQPQAGKQVSGTIAVKAKIDGSAPSTVHVGLGGAKWQPMAKNGDTGEWTAEVDTTMIPNGGQRLMVVTNNKRVQAVTNVTVENPLKIFFADLHSHTMYSDGTLTPLAAHDYARDVAKLDVFSLTDHLEAIDDGEWLDIRETAFDANEDGRFVARPGLEWTKGWGHINIFDCKTRHWPKDPKEFYKAAADAGVIMKFNHPGNGTRSHAGLAYSEIGDKTIQMIELRNNDEEPAFIRALNNGWHLAPEGSDDTHGSNWGNCGTWTGILATGLSKQNIWDAMRNRRIYSTRDRNCCLTFTLNGAPMGTIVDKPAKAVKITVKVDDPDDGDDVAKIEFYEDGKVVETGEKWEGELLIEGSPAAGKHHYFVKVTQKDGNLLWSAPIWVTVEE